MEGARSTPTTCASSAKGVFDASASSRSISSSCTESILTSTPMSSSVSSRTLRDEGKVREVGLSEVSVAQIEAAREIVPIVSVQNLYNIAQRDADEVVELLRTAPHRIHSVVSRWAAASCPPTGGPLAEIASANWRDGVADLVWRGSFAARRSCCPFPGRHRSRISKRTARAADIDLTDAEYQELTEARKAIRRWAMSG